MRRHSLAAFALVLLTSVIATAQQNASVTGVVTDEAKLVMPGVQISATDITSGRQVSVVTNERGEYRLLNLPPSTYRLQAELQGFQTVSREIELLVGQSAAVPFAMKIAGVEATVVVTGETPLVALRTSQVAGNVDRRQMEELPLAGRNWMELALQVKGITANNVVDAPGLRDDQFQLNLDGQQVTQKIAASDDGQPKFSREAIAEFQVVTNLFDITQGRSAGGQVQAISKSGTNMLAGSAYGYFRDDRFNAADHVAGKVLPYANTQTGGLSEAPLFAIGCTTSAPTSMSVNPSPSSSNPTFCRTSSSRSGKPSRRGISWPASIRRFRHETG